MKRNAPVKSGRQASRPVLHLTLHREFFDAIAEGSKKTEYRDNTPYWRPRLVGREYAEIVFRNGYATRAPLMRFSFSASAKKDPTVL
jgi:hypothetical protein